MTTPLLRQVRMALPNATMRFVVGVNVAPLLAGHPFVDELLTFDESILRKPQPWRISEVLDQLKDTDLLFVLDKHWVFSVLAMMSGAPRRIGFRRRGPEAIGLTHSVSYGALRHEIHFYLDLAEVAGIKVNRSDIQLQLPEFSAEVDLPAAYVVVANSGGNNTGERSDVRRMPTSLLLRLVRNLSAKSSVVVLGTAQEAQQYSDLRSLPIINLCGKTTLHEAWSVLRGAQHVYTTDNGLMHMAGALNPHITGIFGPTHPHRKCPPGVHWVWADQAQYDPAYEVFGRTPPKNKRFFSQIDPDVIVRSACHV